MANPLNDIKQGIQKGDWQKVCKAYKSLTGETLTPPTTSTKEKVVTKVVKKTEYIVDPLVSDIIAFYQDKGNYGVKNGVVPVMIDQGEKARLYEKPQVVENKPEPKTKAKSRGKKLIGNIEEQIVKLKSERRPPDNSYDIIDFPCSKCQRSKKARRFETCRVAMGVAMPYVCDSCIVSS